MPIEINHCVLSFFNWIYDGKVAREVFLSPLYIALLIIMLSLLILYFLGYGIKMCDLPRVGFYLVLSTFGVLVVHNSICSQHRMESEKKSEGSKIVESFSRHTVGGADQIPIEPSLSSKSETPEDKNDDMTFSDSVQYDTIQGGVESGELSLGDFFEKRANQ
jgi:hypothetical protein